MDIVGALATAKATLDLVKSLKDLDRELAASELKANMVDLYGNLSEVRMALIDAKEELAEKDRQIEELRGRFKGYSELVEFGGFQYKANEDGKPVGLPLCPACLADDGTQIHPAKLQGQHYKCPRCAALYQNLSNRTGY